MTGGKSAIERMLTAFDHGWPVPTSVIGAAVGEFYGKAPMSTAGVRSRMRRTKQVRYTQTHEALWTPASVRIAFPEFAMIDRTRAVGVHPAASDQTDDGRVPSGEGETKGDVE